MTFDDNLVKALDKNFALTDRKFKTVFDKIEALTKRLEEIECLLKHENNVTYEKLLDTYKYHVKNRPESFGDLTYKDKLYIWNTEYRVLKNATPWPVPEDEVVE